VALQTWAHELPTNQIFDEVSHTCQKSSGKITPHCYWKTHVTSQMRSLPVCKGSTQTSAKTASAFKSPRYPWGIEEKHPYARMLEE
jgi:hypothetical protein